MTLIHELHFSWGVVVALDAVKKINQGEFGGWSLFSLVGAVIVFKKHEVVRLSEHMLVLFTACWRRSKLTPSPCPEQAAASTSGAAMGGPGWARAHPLGPIKNPPKNKNNKKKSRRDRHVHMHGSAQLMYHASSAH